jgi:hypothetical protein
MCKIPIALYVAIIVTSFAITIFPARADGGGAPHCWASLYAYDSGVFHPPRPMPYSVWYYALYEPFCAGKPRGACDWEVHCRGGLCY